MSAPTRLRPIDRSSSAVAAVGPAILAVVATVILAIDAALLSVIAAIFAPLPEQEEWKPL